MLYREIIAVCSEIHFRPPPQKKNYGLPYADFHETHEWSTAMRGEFYERCHVRMEIHWRPSVDLKKVRIPPQ
jgi:hypothetical protein